ncbi:MAG: methylenetetrahydrofolate reductase C-terminal domain-containing protein [Planctomycetota bacterium]|jgi:methylenetetrahydrofolate reductase (NADPH)
MYVKRLKGALEDKSEFVVIVELTGGPNFNFTPIKKFLRAYKDSGDSCIPEGFAFVGITSPHNPGGTPNIETANVLFRLRTQGLLGNLDFIPHISCKDDNTDALISSLAGFRAMDVETVLVITGDKPIKGKGIFELESIGLLQMIDEMNSEAYLKASGDALDDVHQFFAGAVVSPFKYTEASQMQQYYKMEKKISCGTKFITTQVGWDWKKSVELFRYLEENKLEVPVIGNVFFLSTITPAPRLMHDLRLPGCFVSDEFFAKLCSESVDEHIERSAQQVAMYKSIGAAGVDIGSVHDFEMFVRIVERAAEIGDNWAEYKDNLYWPKKDGFYLYDDEGQRVRLSSPKKKFKHKCFDFIDRHFFSQDRKAFGVIRKLMSVLGMQKNKGFMYDFFAGLEYVVKRFLFDCEMCGDCYLPENFGLCTIGGCEKGLANAPCGDATVDGYCGNNLELLCIGEHIYNAAASEACGIAQWRTIINKPRIHSLEQTASILNHLFEKDHSAKVPFVSIGELIHCSIPKTGKIIQQLHNLGTDAYSRPSGPLNYVKALIELQATQNPDYIAVNLDAIGQGGPGRAVDMMIEYVRMVCKWGKNIPICIDSTDNKVIITGLKEWYNTGQTVKPPLLSSIRADIMDEIFAMKRNYDYKFTAPLEGNKQLSTRNKTNSIDHLHSLAERLFNQAVEKYGFEPEEIFFELEVCPLAADMPEANGTPGQTYLMFEAARKIKQDRRTAGAHCLMRPSVVGRELPRSLGVCRAYVGKALEYGFDAAFVDVTHQFGMVEPDPELLKLVDAYTKMDGSAERKEKATGLINELCQQKQKVFARCEISTGN